jgi:hypothetical protein
VGTVGTAQIMKKQTDTDPRTKDIERVMDRLFGDGKAGEIIVDGYVVKREWDGEEWQYIFSKMG